ncbi:hypothetical protein [Synechococcus sp. CS-1332]|uniref:hypothetical protein n=1 Tax=Synechococcus sp. CS-1332 TaxID=2847972 RepID=UPI00223B5DF7|nr:hypothetical protein [Synechococcus sp. CS-1332]MCT0207759.1 hypothetical protein [Synechococcus sp. CS-1332]
MAATFLIVMAVLLGSLAISNRSSMAELASAYQSQGRDAKAAADIGMAAVVSELNRHRNRQLLVNACLLETATPSAIAANNAVKVVDGRAFANIGATFLTSTTIPTAQTLNVGDGSQQQWRLVDVDCSGATAALVRQGTVANPMSGAAAVPPTTGELTLTVRGFALRGGAVVATSTLQQTLEVVPKCLDRSLRGLGNAFGNDIRRCALAPNFGFVAGAADDNTGDLVISGGSYNLNVDPVTCIATSPSGCVDGLSRTSVNVVDINLPPPLPTANTTCRSATPPASCNVTVSSDLTLATRNFATWPAPWNTLCSREDVNGGASPPGTFQTISCSLNRLSTSNNVELFIDTSGTTAAESIPVRLHFPNASTSGQKSVTRGNGSSGIFQCDSDVGAITCTTTTQGAPRAADMALFGCRTGAPAPCGAQFLDLGNGNGASQSMFLYFPLGNVEMGGTPDFKGVIWTNDFRANGNITVTISPSDLESVCGLMKFCGSDDSMYETFAIDYITRAVKRHTYS